MLTFISKLLPIKQLLLWAALVGCFPIHADVLVLVHGWRSNADSWMNSGVHAVLTRNGWQDAGMTEMSPGGIRLLQLNKPTGKNKLYRVNLPAHLGLQAQADFLRPQLNYLRQLNVGEKFIIAAHSAGGIVSRMVLTQQNMPEIEALITIASPHLGTPRAAEGLDIGHSKPFFCPGPGLEIVKNIIGGDDYRYLRHSDALLVDLLPARQGSILNWLNQQAHPNIHYHSIIKQLSGSDNDGVVPVFSQDMNNILRVQGQSTTHRTFSNHALNPLDGELIVKILLSES